MNPLAGSAAIRSNPSRSPGMGELMDGWAIVSFLTIRRLREHQTLCCHDLRSTKQCGSKCLFTSEPMPLSHDSEAERGHNYRVLMMKREGTGCEEMRGRLHAFFSSVGAWVMSGVVAGVLWWCSLCLACCRL
ncbi:hypothetical protein UPYG_G00213490 [Umbra pygmaea]|uniref:Uncharacterized protein n=1 Tax=Umbra pygmaea TaxID=75934 RepID=A0ABD0WQB6_UMBPY